MVLTEKMAGVLARSTQTTDAQASFDAAAAARLAATRASAFRRAAQHSRRVRWLKWLVPAVTLSATAAFVALFYMSRPDVTISSDNQAVTDGQVVMANPKLEGFSRDGRAYSMAAARAIQHLDRKGVITLEGIRARMPVEAGDWATLVAKDGVYDQVANTLELDGDIELTTSSGMVAKLKTAFVDIGAGDMRSDDPVDITRDGSTIAAQSMAVTDGGRFVFEDRVRMNINPQQQKAEQQASGGFNASN